MPQQLLVRAAARGGVAAPRHLRPAPAGAHAAPGGADATVRVRRPHPVRAAAPARPPPAVADQLVVVVLVGRPLPVGAHCHPHPAPASARAAPARQGLGQGCQGADLLAGEEVRGLGVKARGQREAGGVEPAEAQAVAAVSVSGVATLARAQSTASHPAAAQVQAWPTSPTTSDESETSAATGERGDGHALLGGAESGAKDEPIRKEDYSGCNIARCCDVAKVSKRVRR